MSFFFDGAMHRSPPEGWVVWWRRRTIEVCQQVIQQRHMERLRAAGIHMDAISEQTVPMRPSRVVVPQLRKRKRGRR